MLITSCPEHGTVSGPRDTAPAIRDAVLACVADSGDSEHLLWHRVNGTTCWQCCSLMTNHIR